MSTRVPAGTGPAAADPVAVVGSLVRMPHMHCIQAACDLPLVGCKCSLQQLLSLGMLALD